jgi:hypothetical protein
MVCVWSAFPARQLHSFVFLRLGVESLVCLNEKFNLVEDEMQLAACLPTGFETNPDKGFDIQIAKWSRSMGSQFSRHA